MQAIHYIDGAWVDGNPPIMGPMTHAAWMASVVFDGARSVDGTAPDLDLHCARVIRSARSMLLEPAIDAGRIEELARDGIARFPKETALYIRPLFYADTGFVSPDPDSTRFVLSLIDRPMPKPLGLSVCRSSFRRPAPDMAPTDAKASCLYPNAARALREAARRGFDNALVLDAVGNVAETCTANVWLAKDGAAHTPAINGTFLNGITRQRMAQLLRDAGIPVHERAIRYEEFLDADEIFTTGNYGKILPVTKIDDRSLQPGPLFSRACDLYWSYAYEQGAL